MKNKLNRILSLVMALVMLCTVLPVSAAAAESDFVLDGTTLVRYQGTDRHVTVPDGVTTIGENAFLYCDSAVSINLSNSVTSIEKYAFQGCWYLTDIAIPDSVTSIGDCAFQRCDRLVNVVLPNGLTTISVGMFMQSSTLANVFIPASVTAIEHHAFNIRTNIFNKRDKEQWNIYYGGTEAQWNAIDIGADNPDLSSAVVHYNSTADQVLEIISKSQADGDKAYADGLAAYEARLKAEAEAKAARQLELKNQPQLFSDVPHDAWYFEAVNTMAENGMLMGDGTGKFNPDAPITMGEFAVLLLRIYGLKVQPHVTHRYRHEDRLCYGDTHWACDAITTCNIPRNIYNNIEGRYYNPRYLFQGTLCQDANDPMNRGETLAWLASMAEFMPEYNYSFQTQVSEKVWTKGDIPDWDVVETGGIQSVNDNYGSKHCWSQYKILQAYNLDIAHGDVDGTCNPLANITRAEVCQLLYNMGITTPGCVTYWTDRGYE